MIRSQRTVSRFQAMRWVILLNLLAAPLLASEVHWIRAAPTCTEPAPDEETWVQSCGDAGRYFLTTNPAAMAIGCAAEASGSEMAHFYARSNVGPLGRCFGRDGGPWVAVVDVRGDRSKDVGFVVQQSSDGLLDVELLDMVAAHEGMPPRVGLPSDAHVLAVLCDLAQRLDAGADEPPVAMVLPFGRHLSVMPECDLDENSLVCQIDHVLSHLREEYGSVAIAAAGDHRSLTFPAAAPNALAVGALDPARYSLSGELVPSWESPPTTTALMVGTGVAVDLGRATGPQILAPGSHHAAATFAGWLGGTVARGLWQPPRPFPFGGIWAPLGTEDGFALALDHDPLPGSALPGADLVMRRALGLEPANRDPLPTPGYLLSRTEVPISLPADSLPTIIASLTDEWPPLPDILPCIPCAGPPPPNPYALRPSVTGGNSTDLLVIDVSASGSVGGFYELTQVALRIGDSVFGLEGGEDAELLAGLAGGSVTSIGIRGIDAPALQSAGESLALVFLLTYDETPFWHATPLLIVPED